MSQSESIFNYVSPSSVLFTPGMTLRDIEKNVILETLKHQRFNRTRTARILQIGIRTLQRKLKQYQEDKICDQHMSCVAN
jgi:DNA-binding NtrC family response regulator